MTHASVIILSVCVGLSVSSMTLGILSLGRMKTIEDRLTTDLPASTPMRGDVSAHQSTVLYAFTNQTSLFIEHGLSSRTLVAYCFDEAGGEVFLRKTSGRLLYSADPNSVRIDFMQPTSGTLILTALSSE